jgi:TatD DNase family protein
VMRLTDTHCHLNLNTFQDDLEAVIERALAAGVQRILVPGIDLESSLLAVELAQRHPILFAAVGIHPSSAAEFDVKSIDELFRLAQRPKVAAIGEIGLDFYRDRAPRGMQRDVFQAQLDLAGELKLPVVIHNRDAFSEVHELLSAWVRNLKAAQNSTGGRPGVMHSFDGTLEQAQESVELGFFVGISGPVTFKNAHEKQRVAAGLPLESLLIETDAPFLTPHPHRGERNEPAYTEYISRKLAEIRGIGAEEIAGITAENAARLFVWES